MSKITELQDRLSSFNDKVSVLEREASRMEGQHGELVKQLRLKEEEFHATFPKARLDSFDEAKLEELMEKNEVKLSQAEDIVTECKKILSEDEGILI